MTIKKPKKDQELRCCKCLVTLERLKKDGICDFLIKIVEEKGSEKYICQLCLEGW